MSNHSVQMPVAGKSEAPRTGLFLGWLFSPSTNLFPRKPGQPTLDSFFQWLLGLATIGSIFNAIKQFIFFFVLTPWDNSIAFCLGYLAIPLAGAIFNAGCWWYFRGRGYRQSWGILLLVGNSLMLTGVVLAVFPGYRSVFLPFLIPCFFFLATFTGILLDFKRSMLVVTVLACEYIGILHLARAQGIAVEMDGFSFMPATTIVFYLIAVLVGLISQQMQITEAALKRANAQLEDAQATLSRYVAPQLAQKIRSGEGSEVANHQRRKLTIFFSDIKDFSPTTDSMEPEDLARLLNEYIDEMVLIAMKHNGTVAQISGDGLFIFFGAPEFVDDREHALRAVRMAVEMQRRMRELQRRWYESGIEHPFQIRCGINTGIATVGGFGSAGRREYTAIGMQTNLAARLEAACEPGSILLGHATWALVKEEFPCKEMGLLEVKGFHQPVRTWQVILDNETR
jgi:class 3 adenylate cyclase